MPSTLHDVKSWDFLIHTLAPPPPPPPPPILTKILICVSSRAPVRAGRSSSKKRDFCLQCLTPFYNLCRPCWILVSIRYQVRYLKVSIRYRVLVKWCLSSCMPICFSSCRPNSNETHVPHFKVGIFQRKKTKR